MSKKINSRKEKFIERVSEYGNIYKKNEGLLKFNLKYFSHGIGFGQSFEEWQETEILAELNNKLKDFSEKTKLELLQDGTLEIYMNGYPKNSEFQRPKVLEGLDIRWARLRITGRRRLIGFFLPENIYEDDNKQLKKFDTNVFYIVFLDKDHQFAPSKKKNT